ERYGLGVVRWLALAAVPLVPIASTAALLYAMDTRPQWVAMRESVQSETARQERRALSDRYRRDAAGVDGAARATFASASTVLDKGAGGGTAEEKERAIGDLSQARANLLDAKAKLADGPAYRDAEIEELRQGVLEYLQAFADLCALGENYLREDQNLLNE